MRVQQASAKESHSVQSSRTAEHEARENRSKDQVNTGREGGVSQVCVGFKASLGRRPHANRPLGLGVVSATVQLSCVCAVRAYS
jgi:hypothetical protein